VAISYRIRNNTNPGDTIADRLAQGLGWFSFGLGMAELVAPGRLTRAFGLEGKENLLRAYGGREMAAGVGALSARADVGMWSRVAGDIVDLGTLAIGMKNASEAQRRNAAIAIAAVAGITILDAAVATMLSRQRSSEDGEDGDSRSADDAVSDHDTGTGSPDFASSSKAAAAPALEKV
jgi:hypothetical protein